MRIPASIAKRKNKRSESSIRMNDEEMKMFFGTSLFKKIVNKELTVCETCDTIFNYLPKKLFCDECLRKKYNARKRKWREEHQNYEENRKKKAAYDRKRYRAKKNQEE